MAKRLKTQLGFNFDEPVAESSGPVECLGMTFESEAARRAFFLDKLREKLADPEFRKIEGFPIGSDEDILALSDPPYYTACPNPFLEDFICHYGKPWDSATPYHKEPFAADVSEGKNDPIYNAHSYHTKVPHKAIMRYILHYTEPGDVVFDGFCGTGMTGVAAQLCGDINAVQSLGYQVQNDGVILDQFGHRFSRLGARYAVLNDLSPMATFIAYNYNTPVDVQTFERDAGKILREVEKECGWMYATLHKPTADQLAEVVARLNDDDDPKKLIQDTKLPWGRINYTVWSDVFSCPHCGSEIIFWDAAVNKSSGAVLDIFVCPNCQKHVAKKHIKNQGIEKAERAWTTKFDPVLGQMIRQAKQVPVLINYTVREKRFEKVIDIFDMTIIDFIENQPVSTLIPKISIPDGDKTGEPIRIGVTHIHHFFSSRSLRIFFLLFSMTSSSIEKLSLLGGYTVGLITARFLPLRWIQKDTGPMKPHTTGTLYIPSMSGEQNWLNIFQSRCETSLRCIKYSQALKTGRAFMSTGSFTHTKIPNCSIDYLFLDPPFGSNLMYSELNIITESWLGVTTENKHEAIENATQQKTINEYRNIMTSCFKESFRILKPGRWVTVEFSNTKASVWNAIQAALLSSGFVIANVSALDKQQGSFNAVTNTTSVKQDLVISAYKPNGGLEERFARTAKNEAGVWDFIRTHLGYLANVKSKGDELEFIPERDPRILFDQLVAWYVRHNFDVPISSAEFQEGLNQRFLVRDGMVFLETQVAEYDRAREKAKSPPQMTLFVTDERSAIDWLRIFLKKKPATYQEIHTEFMQQLNIAWKAHEVRPELDDLLAQNFLQYDGQTEVPAQLHSYLSTNFKELRNLEKNDPALRERAMDRWYVPDPNRAIDLEKLRERALLKEFESYKNAKEKRLKVFRLEAVRAGFKKAWQTKDVDSIITVAKKIPESVLEEDPKLIMWYDQAVNRIEENNHE